MFVVILDQYVDMFDCVKVGGFVYFVFNVLSLQIINVVLQGLIEVGFDGIIQVIIGGVDYFVGYIVKVWVIGVFVFVWYVIEVVKNYFVMVVLYIDYCLKDVFVGFVELLIVVLEEEVKVGCNLIFQLYMWDGLVVFFVENIEIVKEFFFWMKVINVIFEVEIGVVGGEEDGVQYEGLNEVFYMIFVDVDQVVQVLGFGEQGCYIVVFMFGNVYGVYKLGGVKLCLEFFGEIQVEVVVKYNIGVKLFDFVFYGGFGLMDEEIVFVVVNGVIKMNIDIDMQYVYMCVIVDYMFKNYDGVFKVDGEVGNKKQYDLCVWGKVVEFVMVVCVVELICQLGLYGQLKS